jgi:hypothetical protein
LNINKFGDLIVCRLPEQSSIISISILSFVVSYSLTLLIMLKNDNVTVMKAIAICFKPYLKPEEAMIYCNLQRTRMAWKFKECGIVKTASGYYKNKILINTLPENSPKIPQFKSERASSPRQILNNDDSLPSR